MDADVVGRMTHGRQAFRQLAGDLACLAVNGMTTRGPVNGHHVSSIYWFKTYVVGRSRPRDLRAGAKTWQRAANQVPPVVPCYIYGAIYIYMFVYACGLGRTTGPRLSPSPWSHDMLHITPSYIIWMHVRGCVCSNGYINDPPFGL
jgi:hypothetical protein